MDWNDAYEKTQKHVWIVSYVIKFTQVHEVPVITVFTNKEAAEKCYQAFVDDGKRNVQLTECHAYDTFEKEETDA